MPGCVSGACFAAPQRPADGNDRYWPLWASGCAFAIVAVHFASMLNTAVDPRIYHGLRSLWAIPMQLFMVRGIVLDVRHQSRVAR